MSLVKFRKYILVPEQKEQQEHQQPTCNKLFVNVMSSSRNDRESIICCSDAATTTNVATINNLSSEGNDRYDGITKPLERQLLVINNTSDEPNTVSQSLCSFSSSPTSRTKVSRNHCHE